MTSSWVTGCHPVGAIPADCVMGYRSVGALPFHDFVMGCRISLRWAWSR